ncbi:MAG TPA: hypothetical protein PLH94_00490 [Fimbriimonadaceae bacterium]|nr:hypothetical protein [Fimbriimonadaceae bacterium]
MVFRNLSLVGLIGVAMAVSAAAGVEGALGGGQLENASGEKGMVNVAVQKRTDNAGNVRVGGHFHFGRRTGNRSGVEVGMRRAAEVAVTGNSCTFSGPAVYVTITDGTRSRVEGTVSATVEDKRRPRATGDPDTCSFTFTSTDGATTYSFSGNLTRGDIKVGTRP